MTELEQIHPNKVYGVKQVVKVLPYGIETIKKLYPWGRVQRDGNVYHRWGGARLLIESQDLPFDQEMSANILGLSSPTYDQESPVPFQSLLRSVAKQRQTHA